MIVVVELSQVESDELEDHKSDSEDICFVLVKFGCQFQIGKTVELFRGEQVLRKSFLLGKYFKVTAVTVALFYFQKIEFNVPFRTQENFFASKVGLADFHLLQLVGKVKQRFGNIEEISF